MLIAANAANGTTPEKYFSCTVDNEMHLKADVYLYEDFIISFYILIHIVTSINRDMFCFLSFSFFLFAYIGTKHCAFLYHQSVCCVVYNNA